MGTLLPSVVYSKFPAGVCSGEATHPVCLLSLSEPACRSPVQDPHSLRLHFQDIFQIRSRVLSRGVTKEL